MTHWNFDRMAAAVFDAAYPPILGNPPRRGWEMVVAKL
jgi:hypothetical protein